MDGNGDDDRQKTDSQRNKRAKRDTDTDIVKNKTWKNQICFETFETTNQPTSQQINEKKEDKKRKKKNKLCSTLKHTHSVCGVVEQYSHFCRTTHKFYIYTKSE